MRIEEVMLVAFGPFRNRRVLIAPGMTVIAGPNEAGKSSIHAALYAAICGIRRAKGPARHEDQAFAEQHKPWNEGKSWEVQALLALDDGRRVEMKQVLDGSSKSRATKQSGRDVTTDIANDGSPDASLWLGLDRRSFRATAFVRQAEVLEVLQDAELLQGHLQQAAAGASRDETAAVALARIDEWEREGVGLDRANSSKPLRRAKDRLAEAITSQSNQHENAVLLQTKLTAARAADNAVNQLASQISMLEAGVARWEADDLMRRFKRAQDLAEHFANGAPIAPENQDGLLATVVRALQSWANRPVLSSSAQAGANELRRELEQLPDVPEGDINPHETVTAAKATHDRAVLALELHDANRPLQIDEQASRDVTERELDELIEVLGRSQMDVERSPDTEIAQPESPLGGRHHRRPLPRLEIGIGVTLLLVGTALLARGDTWPAVLVFAVGAVVTALAIRATSQRHVAGVDVGAALKLSADRTKTTATLESMSARRSAEERIQKLGLPSDVQQLRALAGTLASRKLSQQEHARWEERRLDLARSLGDAETGLWTAMHDRGAKAVGDVRATYDLYVSESGKRSQQAVLAAQRTSLQERLALRENAEREAAAALQTISAAEQSLREAANACGLSDTDGETLHRQLTQWLDRRKDLSGQRDVAQREWTELQTLLDGRELAEFSRETDTREKDAVRLEAAVGGVSKAKPSQDVSSILPRLRSERDEATRRAATLHADAEATERAVPSAQSVEAVVTAAKAELQRVERLQGTLSLTRDFLDRAQDRVHRAVAPLLQATLDLWLPRITKGRYVESLVDPETLRVRLRSATGHLRDAQLLSHGTMEQAYLLLRIAIIEHLTRGRESCPLILDDVVVQSDSERTRALLGLLHEISSTKQVILFTVSNEAATWAAASLHEPRDRFERLDAAAVPA